MKKLFLSLSIIFASISSALAWPGPSVQDAWNSNYIVTATTTVVKTGKGILHTITVEGGTAGTITVYDNTAASGTKLADFSSTNAIATYTFDVAFATGLTIVTSAATSLTVSYK